MFKYPLDAVFAVDEAISMALCLCFHNEGVMGVTANCQSKVPRHPGWPTLSEADCSPQPWLHEPSFLGLSVDMKLIFCCNASTACNLVRWLL